MYGSATGQFGSSSGNIFALPTGVTLSPGQNYLIQLSSPGTGGVALPVTPDATTTNLSMSGTNGKVALTNGLTPNSCGATATPCTLPNAQIVDLVSWGTANNAEGGASTNGGASLTATQGNVRKGAGCTDTDDNNADFDVITAPVPRNSATTPTPCGAAAVTQHVLDYNGDGKTDFSVVRNTGGGPSGQVSWYNCYNGLAEPGCWQFVDFGLASDFFVPADYDGDQKTDIAVWRPGTQAYFYILQSATNTVRADAFGQTGDDPTMVGDYTGDGKADPAVYRAGATAGAQSYWYYRASSGTFSGQIVYEPWGQNGDFPAPGDYDGDGKADFMVQRSAGGGQAIFWLRTNTTNNVSNYIFGTPTDVIVPGDYDGDGKTDIAVIRGSGGSINWYVRKSSAPPAAGDQALLATFGLSATDFPVQGDFDGDGKTDVAIWRPDAANSANNYFWVRSTGSGAVTFKEWGQNGDYPVGNYNAH